MHPVKTCASFGTKPFSERGNRKLSTCRKTAVFFRKLENSDKRPKNIRMGIWVKNRFSGGTISRKCSTPGSNVSTRVRINQPRGRDNVEKGGHSSSSLKGESISKQLVSSSTKGWGNRSVNNRKALNSFIPYSHFKIERSFAQESSKISPISMEGQHLRVLVSMFWSASSTSDFLQNY